MSVEVNDRSMQSIKFASEQEPIAHAVVAILRQIERLAGASPASNPIDEAALKTSLNVGADRATVLLVDSVVRSLARVDMATGVTDHGDLTGLADDDHTQYHNDARGDARYYIQATIDTHTGDATIHFTEASISLANLGTRSVDNLSDADTTTAVASLNDVLKWDGTNWVPGTAGDTSEFTFSIDSFSDAISDTLQLIGSGEWKAIAAITFTATYSNEPGGMTAEVAQSGATTAWAGNLSMTPTTGPETNTEAVDYPTSATGTVTFTLSQSADGTTDTESVSFSNTLRYESNANGIGAQTEANIEALTEVPGPDESRNQGVSNIPTPTGGHFLTFAYASRLSDPAQVQLNEGFGYITASFNSTATTVAPTVQTSGLTTITNSAGFVEAFDAITSRLADIPDGVIDWRLRTSSTAVNNFFMGGNTESTPGNYTESDIETGLTDPYQVATNDTTQTWPTVTLASSEHYVFAMPSRLTTPTFFDNDTGFEASFQSPATLALTNTGGFTEDYKIFVSTNPLGPGDFNLRTA